MSNDIKQEPVAVISPNGFLQLNDDKYVGNLYRDHQPAPDVAAMQRTIERQQSAIDGYVVEIDTLKADANELRAKTFAKFNGEECWIWQGDGEDHLESLVCPVVISPASLMAMQARIAELERVQGVLVEACRTFVLWLQRESEGFVKAGNERDTPEGEQRWRDWYYENLRLCALAQDQASAALAAVQKGIQQ